MGPALRVDPDGRGGLLGRRPSGHGAGGAQALVWGNCPGLPEGATRDPRQTCATLRVPLDYQHPEGRTLELTVSRIATARPDSRRGVLLLNPGGPGLEGLDHPSLLATVLSSEVLDHYDLIGFDPRGVGHSSPVTCGLTDVGFTDLFPYPAADGSIDANVALARETAARCAASTSGDVLPFITTANTARDMDRLRQALGKGRSPTGASPTAPSWGPCTRPCSPRTPTGWCSRAMWIPRVSGMASPATGG
ncbi:alpha/beta fold hydrolase [Cystobacter fuscus]